MAYLSMIYLHVSHVLWTSICSFRISFSPVSPISLYCQALVGDELYFANFETAK